MFKVQSKKFGELNIIVDSEDLPLLQRLSWNISYIVNKYSKQQKPYICTSINSKTVYLHRLIMGNPKYKSIDHINGDTLDNRKENLRICTHQQNHFNRPANSNGSSKYKGVCWNKASKKWQAQIKINKKNKVLGQFVSETEAALAYNVKAKELFGEFAYINQI